MGFGPRLQWIVTVVVVVVVACGSPPAWGQACGSIVSSASLDGCSVPTQAEWGFTCTGGAWAETVVDQSGNIPNCWLVTHAAAPLARCMASRPEPALATAPAYRYEGRFRVAELSPNCGCDQSTCACIPAAIFVPDGTRRSGVFTVRQPEGQFVGFADSSSSSGAVWFALDLFATHRYRVEVENGGTVRYLVDEQLLHAIPYDQLPIDDGSFGTVEIFYDQYATTWFDYVTYDICGAGPPLPSFSVGLKELTTKPAPYQPGVGYLNLKTWVRVTKTSPEPDTTSQYVVQLTQKIRGGELYEILAVQMPWASVDVSALLAGDGVTAQVQWDWDGKGPNGAAAPRGWATIETHIELVRSRGPITEVVAAADASSQVWLGMTKLAWGLLPGPTAMATPVFAKTYSLAAGTGGMPNKVTYTFTAFCTEPPVMRLYKKKGNRWEQAVADLNAGATQVATVSAPVKKSGMGLPEQHRVLVHTRAQGPIGSCDVFQTCDAPTCPPAPGTKSSGRISLPYFRLTAPVDPGDVLESVLVPFGASDTILYAVKGGDATLDRSLETILATDDDSGIGGASRISPLPQDADAFLVASKQGSPPGEVRVYINDRTDADGDGVGAKLEAELGTCDSGATQPAPGVTMFEPCSAIASRRPWPEATIDTDADGIPDYFEVFGCTADSSKQPPQAHCNGAYPGGTFDQALPRWGADPRHMDLFLEGDSICDDEACSAHPPRVTHSDIAQWAAAFAAGPADHLRNPDQQGGISLHVDIGLPPPSGSTSTASGDWGGYTEVPHSFVTNPRPEPPWFSDHRRGIFHYGAFRDGGPPGAWFGFSFNGGRGGGTVNWHEFGHTLGLTHGGADAVNCKPHYHSVMNYAYQWTALGYSTGQWESFLLNPSQLDETSGLGTTAMTDVAFLADYPFDLLHQASSWNGTIDWNRSGHADTSTRAFLTDHWNCDSWYRRDELCAVTSARPAVERFDAARLYVFFRGPTGKLEHTHTTAADFAASACLENDPRNNHALRGCGRWVTQPTSSFESLVGGPSALWVPEYQGILVVYRRPDFGVDSKLLATPWGLEPPSLTNLWAGPVAPVGAAASDPTITRLGDYLYVLFAAADGSVRQWRRPADPYSTQNWTETPAVDWHGAALRSRPLSTQPQYRYAVALTRAYDALEREVLYGVFVPGPDDRAMRTYVLLDPAAGRWGYLDTFGGSAPETWETPAVAFWPFVHGSKQGRLFLWYTARETRDGSVVYTPRRRYQVPSTAGGVFDRDAEVVSYHDYLPVPEPSILYYDDRSVKPNLRGAKPSYALRDTQCGDAQPREYLDIYPYADGAFDIPLKDYSDFKLMRVGLCMSLRVEPQPCVKWKNNYLIVDPICEGCIECVGEGVHLIPFGERLGDGTTCGQ
ncbi:MAG: hypothetical protein HY828_20825 [Actinobacteria bacterium]|nr:hypothetical protein [Actinomycetota bacterium]